MGDPIQSRVYRRVRWGPLHRMRPTGDGPSHNLWVQVNLRVVWHVRDASQMIGIADAILTEEAAVVLHADQINDRISEEINSVSDRAGALRQQSET